MNIYPSKFQPTYLYIKQHSITGKLYFGKTNNNPENYNGSGTHWKRHIKKHGKENVITLWYCLFYTQEECVEFSLNFSEQQNIVESEDWLNLKLENGLDGSPKGVAVWNTGLTKITDSRVAENGKATSKSLKGRIPWNVSICHSIETKAKIGASSRLRKGQSKIQPKSICKYCNITSTNGNIKRWHNDNCKLKTLIFG